MTILRFKTNINSAGCVAAVKPLLDKEEGIDNWQVDITGEDKLLRVQGSGVDSRRVEELVKKAGFKAEEVTAR